MPPSKSSPRLTGIPGGLALNDGLMNVATGAGTDRDRSIHNRWTMPGMEGNFVTPLGDDQIDAAYLTSWMVRKVHDIIPQDMTSEWRTWNLKAGDITKVEAEEKRLGVRDRCREALRYARIRGGAALILGLPGDPATPAPETVGPGGLQYVVRVNRQHLRFAELDYDPRRPTFMQPPMFELTTRTDTTPIHPSRVIEFPGLPSPDGPSTSDEDRFWGRPLLEALNDALQNAHMSQDTGAAMMPVAISDVIKIPGLTDMVSTSAGEARLANRLRVAQLMRSMFKAVVLDGGAPGVEGSGEEWDSRELSFSQIPEMMMAFVQFVCGACDIPMTRFVGTAPKGLNATGEGDDRNYRAKIAKDQKDELRPRLERLDAYLLPSAGVRAPGATFAFAPLDQKTGKEQAEEDKLRAEGYNAVKTSGLVPPDALSKTVVAALAESPNYPGLAENVATAKEPIPAIREAEEATTMGEAKVKQLTTPAGKVATKPRPRDSIEDASRPRTLYVSRKVLNPQEVLNHFRGQGLGDILVAAGELHVTIVWSKTPVDWMKLPTDWSGWSDDGKLKVPPGGPRTLELFGPLGDTLVLAFKNADLEYRHGALREAGIEWEWDDYQPHITLAKVPVDFDVKTLEPYRGRIVLGPEAFMENAAPDQAGPDETLAGT